MDWTDPTPHLFALENGPLELHDLGLDPGYADARRNARQTFAWMRDLRRRTIVKVEQVVRRTAGHGKAGVHHGIRDEE